MTNRFKELRIEDKRCDARLGMYQFLIDGEWIGVNPYDYHCFEIGDAVPQYVVERGSE
ncbi:hypothetical protein ACXM1Q_001780 [Streptococcus sp. 10F2]